MPFTRDVGIHLIPVGQTNTSHLPQRGIGLLRGLRKHAKTNTSSLRTLRQVRRTRSGNPRLPALAYQLLNCRHATSMIRRRPGANWKGPPPLLRCRSEGFPIPSWLSRMGLILITPILFSEVPIQGTPNNAKRAFLTRRCRSQRKSSSPLFERKTPHNPSISLEGSGNTVEKRPFPLCRSRPITRETARGSARPSENWRRTAEMRPLSDEARRIVSDPRGAVNASRALSPAPGGGRTSRPGAVPMRAI